MPTKGALILDYLHMSQLIYFLKIKTSTMMGFCPNTVKPLITDPPKSGQPLYSRWLNCPLSTAFVMPPSLDSKTEHYISTVAHHVSLSRQRKATGLKMQSHLTFNSPRCPITHYTPMEVTKCL